MAYQKARDFFLDVSRGLVNKTTHINKFGRNIDVDTGTDEDIWATGGTFAEPTTAQTMIVTSSSASDTISGTGARTLFIEGLDSSYNIVSETITLNGTSNVNSVGTYTFINRAYVLTFGSGGTNAGNITVTAQIDATVQATVLAGFAQTLNAIYMIPNGYKGYLRNISGSFQQSSANSIVDIALLTKTFGSGGYRVRDYVNLTNTGESFFQKEYEPYIEFQAKDLIKLRALSASTNNNDVSGGFDLFLVQD